MVQLQKNLTKSWALGYLKNLEIIVFSNSFRKTLWVIIWKCTSLSFLKKNCVCMLFSTWVSGLYLSTHGSFSDRLSFEFSRPYICSEEDSVPLFLVGNLLLSNVEGTFFLLWLELFTFNDVAVLEMLLFSEKSSNDGSTQSVTWREKKSCKYYYIFCIYSL